MDPQLKELTDIIALSTAMSQERIEAMIRALIEKGWTICPIESVKEELR